MTVSRRFLCMYEKKPADGAEPLDLIRLMPSSADDDPDHERGLNERFRRD
jgi:hypothetical protein